MDECPTEINELIKDTERKFGQKIYGPKDFDLLASLMNVQLKTNLSASTLKRLWGYVPYDHRPRLSTLNLLAQYNGYADFIEYKNSKNDDNNSSSFFSTGQVLAVDLNPGQHLEIEWAPNRYLLLEHIQDTLFTVLLSRNSKLKEGDSFYSPFFELGQPLYLPFVMRDGEKLSSFIAGKSGGLTFLNLPDNED